LLFTTKPFDKLSANGGEQLQKFAESPAITRALRRGMHGHGRAVCANIDSCRPA
jgi:hypothetical protein